jgi:hypothetical protein
VRWITELAVLTLALPAAAVGQQSSPVGTWRVTSGADTRGGRREVIIRADSGASWGEGTVRWRLKPRSRIAIAIGDEWEVYDLKVNAKKLRLSGGDFQEAITLRRVGPPTPRATGMAVPAAPPED